MTSIKPASTFQALRVVTPREAAHRASEVPHGLRLRRPDFSSPRCGSTQLMPQALQIGIAILTGFVGFRIKNRPGVVTVSGFALMALTYIAGPVIHNITLNVVGYTVGMALWMVGLYNLIRGTGTKPVALDRQLNLLGDRMERTFAPIFGSKEFKKWLLVPREGPIGRLLGAVHSYCYESRGFSRGLWFGFEDAALIDELAFFFRVAPRYLNGSHNAYFQSKRLPLLAIVLAANPFMDTKENSPFAPPEKGWLRLVLEASMYHAMKRDKPVGELENPLSPDGLFQSPAYYQRELERFDHALTKLEERFPWNAA